MLFDMIHRSSHTAHKTSSRNLSRPILKKNRQKLLISPKKNRTSKQSKNYISPFLRVFISGLLILGGIAILFFLKKNLTHSIDLNDSYTLAIQEPSDEGQQVTVLSLRGSDKSANFSVISARQSELIRYFPIDAEVHVKRELNLGDKSSFAALFAPWNREPETKLSLFSRIKIWQYLLTIDSAHFQEQKFSDDSDRLLLTVQKYFADTELRQLAPTIAVVNTTQQNGLAKRQADIFNAWGFTVIQVDSNNQQTLERTKLIVDSELIKTHSAQRLQLAFPDLEMTQDEQQLRFYRTQFVLFIGNDYK